MIINLHLSVEDIVTSKIGVNYQIETQGGVNINFSPASLAEFLKDVDKIFAKEQEEESSAEGEYALREKLIERKQRKSEAK